jgi:hypothetical protein
MREQSSRDKEKPKYEYPVFGINWTAGVGRPAGIYWLDGKSLIAAHGSPAEEYLVELGAVLVATLCFDGDPLERSHYGRRVERLAPCRLIEPSYRSPTSTRCRRPDSNRRRVSD